MKQKRLSSKIVLKNMFHYLIFVVLLFALIMPIYLQSLHIVKKNLSDRFYQDIEGGIQLLENEISIQRTIAERLKANSQIRALSAQTSMLRTEQYYTLNQTHGYFRDLFSGLSLKNNVMLLFKSNDIIFEYDRMHDNGNLFYGSVWKFDGHSYESLRDFLFSRTYRGEFVPSLRYAGSDGRLADLTYVQSFSAGAKGAGSVLISTYYADAILKKCGLDKLTDIAEINITSTDGMPLYHTGSSSGGITKISYLSSDLKFKIDLSVPDSYFATLTTGVLKTIYVYIAIAVLLGVVAIIWFAYRQYMPLARLIDYVNTASPDVAAKGNAYSILKSGIDSLKQENSEANHKLIDTLFTNLAIKGLSENEYQMLAANIEIDSYYLVLLRNNDAEDYEWLNVLLSEFEENQLYWKYKSVIDTKNIVMLMETATTELEALKALIFKMINREKWNLKLAVSGKCCSFRDVTDIYRQLKEIIRYLDSSYFIILDDLKQQEQTDFLYENSLKRELYEHIRNGDVLLANKIVYEQWYELSENPRLSNDIEQLFYLQSSVLAQAALDIGYDGALPDFDRDASVLDLALAITRTIDDLITYMNENKKSGDLRTEKILEYIAENYCNAQFYMQDIAEHFSLSPKTIGLLVKNATGSRYSDYIGTLRIEHAAGLLTETDMPISDIALQSGFDSSNAFYKAFKKVYYTSPSQYRFKRSK